MTGPEPAVDPQLFASMEALGEAIEAGRVAPGTRLPAERDLAATFAVSRTQIRKVLDDLFEEHLLVRLRGRSGGTVVAEPRVRRDLRVVAGVPRYLASQGFVHSCTVLRAGVRTPGFRSRHALRLDDAATVCSIVRLRRANGRPFSLETAEFPAARFPGLADRDLTGSLYEVLTQRYGVVIGHSEELVEAVNASPREAELLEAMPGAALLAVNRVTMDADGVPFEHSRDLFVGTRVTGYVTAVSPESSCHASQR